MDKRERRVGGRVWTCQLLTPCFTTRDAYETACGCERIP